MNAQRGKKRGGSCLLSPRYLLKKIRIIKLLQNAEYEADEYQDFRRELIKDTLKGIRGLNPWRIEVKLEIRYVEKYKDEKCFECMSDVDKEDIIVHLPTLISSCEVDENAVNFDNAMYGLILSALERNKNLKRIKNHLQKNAETPFGILIRKLQRWTGILHMQPLLHLLLKKDRMPGRYTLSIKWRITW